MSAIRLAEIILNHCNEKIREHHAQMDKGLEHEAYLKMVGRQHALKELSTRVRELLGQIEGEDLDEL